MLNKTTGFILLAALAASCYFAQKVITDKWYTAESRPAGKTPPIYETVGPSATFVEQKRSFSYNSQTIQYLLIFPARYTQTTTQWPIILFLHGSSLRGQNLDLVKEYGPTWLAERRDDFPFVVLAPQCSEAEDWEDKSALLAALLDEVIQKYRIDQDRVYLTGTSMGGRGTWTLACQHPDYFAAIAPLAAAKPIIPASWPKNMFSMPIWAFHGEEDTVAPLQDAEAIIHSLRQQGGAPRFTILPDQGHTIAGIYKEQELYDWFLTHTRTQPH